MLSTGGCEESRPISITFWITCNAILFCDIRDAWIDIQRRTMARVEVLCGTWALQEEKKNNN